MDRLVIRFLNSLLEKKSQIILQSFFKVFSKIIFKSNGYFNKCLFSYVSIPSVSKVRLLFHWHVIRIFYLFQWTKWEVAHNRRQKCLLIWHNEKSYITFNVNTRVCFTHVLEFRSSSTAILGCVNLTFFCSDGLYLRGYQKWFWNTRLISRSETSKKCQ